MRRILTTSAISFVCLTALVGCSWTSLPPLLEGARAGGFNPACLPRADWDRTARGRDGRLIVPLEIDERLEKMFPPGTRNEAVIAELQRQEFVVGQPCREDSRVQTAIFRKNGIGLPVYGAHAVVYWRLDSHGNVEWTKGWIDYSAL